MLRRLAQLGDQLQRTCRREALGHAVQEGAGHGVGELDFDEVGDAAQRASYARFVNAFAARARGGALPDPAALPTEIPHALLVPTGDATDPPGAIPRRAAFWDRPAGQAVGLTLILLVVVVAAALILLGGSASSWFRLVAVLLPGGAWLVWRLYLRR